MNTMAALDLDMRIKEFCEQPKVSLQSLKFKLKKYTPRTFTQNSLQ